MKTIEEQKTTGSVIYVKTEEGGFSLVVKPNTKPGEKPESVGTIKINTKAYDEESHSWVESDDVLNDAIETFKTLGTTLENATKDLIGKQINIYAADDRVSLRPIRVFERFDRVTAVESKAIRKMNKPLPLNAITDYLGTRFNFSVDVPINGETKHYRLSQLIIEPEDETQDDITLSPKYTTREIDGYKKDISDNKIANKVVIKNLQDAIRDLTANSKASKIEEINSLLNINLEALIESGATDAFEILPEVRQITGSENTAIYYVVGRIDSRNDDVIDKVNKDAEAKAAKAAKEADAPKDSKKA